MICDHKDEQGTRCEKDLRSIYYGVYRCSDGHLYQQIGTDLFLLYRSPYPANVGPSEEK